MIKSSQICGWFLLLLGIGIILWTLYSSYNIFTGKAPVPEIFKIEQSISPAPESSEQSKASQDQPQDQIEKMFQEQIQNIIPSMPSNSISTILNLFAWSMFNGILMFGASRISGIGVKLIKTNS